MQALPINRALCGLQLHPQLLQLGWQLLFMLLLLPRRLLFAVRGAIRQAACPCQDRLHAEHSACRPLDWQAAGT